MFFVDRVELFVKGGDGGHGCLSFRREKFVPRGGPDGGDGGHGGDVVVKAISGTNSLAQLSSRRHWIAEKGQSGQGKNKTGKCGEDLIIPVPPGTLVKDRERNYLLKDLNQQDVQVTVAHGGRGGRGNTHFASATNQAPRRFEHGKPGEERWIVLELKSIADVGLIGLPNAGKSTLLSRITEAHPEIADYPFTTKYPNLGICTLSEDRRCGIADIPGLIEGAHDGVGLGHEFLRHVERTRLLVHLVECQPASGVDPAENYATIRNELKLYSPALANKPEIVLLTKADVTDDVETISAALSEAVDKRVFAISSATGAGLDHLRRLIAKALDRLDAKENVQRPADPVVPPHLRPPVEQD